MNGVGEGLGETLVLSVQLLLLVLVPSSAVSDPRFVFDLLDDSLLCLPLLRWNREPTTKKTMSRRSKQLFYCALLWRIKPSASFSPLYNFFARAYLPYLR